MTNLNLETQTIAIFIAFLSIIWSAITYYLTYLRKAKLKALYPRLLAFSKLEKGIANVVITIPLVFVNSGARMGIVEDMKLVVNHNNEQSIFLWQTELDSTPPRKKRPTMASSFSIKGQGSIVKLCGFVADLPKYSFSEGKYTAKLMIMNQEAWKHCITFGFELNSKDIQHIEKGDMYISFNITPIEAHEVKL